MTDRDLQESSDAAGNGGQPKRSRLGQILADRPEARPRLSRAVGSLLATVLVAIAALGLLLIWHLRRRAQLIRDRLGPPRDVTLPDLSRPGDDDPRPPAGVRDPAPR
jgi:ferric-dicitrate binding protein FerR (iron transport regulator)